MAIARNPTANLARVDVMISAMKQKNAKPHDVSVHYGFVADDTIECAAQRIGEAVLSSDINAGIYELIRALAQKEKK